MSRSSAEKGEPYLRRKEGEAYLRRRGIALSQAQGDSPISGAEDSVGEVAEPRYIVGGGDGNPTDKFLVVQDGYFALHLTDRFFDGHGGV
jgi:hypothetical protein